MRAFLISAALAATVSASTAFAADTSGSDTSKACLRVSQIYNFDPRDDRTLIVEDNWHKKFKVDLLGTCVGLSFRQTIAIKTIGGTGLSCVSAGDNVITREPGIGVQRCSIKSVTLYTPEMEKADKDAAAAKKAKDSAN